MRGSVRGVTNSAFDAAGNPATVKIERTIYRPYGNWDATGTWLGTTAPPESHGYIGEHLDPEAGLQYLNARCHAPRLALLRETLSHRVSRSSSIIQPDWWDVTQPGVGTNRYAYAGDVPVNGSDPRGATIVTGSTKSPRFAHNG